MKSDFLTTEYAKEAQSTQSYSFANFVPSLCSLRLMDFLLPIYSFYPMFLQILIALAEMIIPEETPHC
jgi:hypothetical protein